MKRESNCGMFNVPLQLLPVWSQEKQIRGRKWADIKMNIREI
jgi:hypothetical protein